MVNVTKHAYKRMKERCGYSKSTCQRMAEKAFRKVSVMQMYQEDWISIFINYIVMITRQIICGSMENLSMSFLTTIS